MINETVKVYIIILNYKTYKDTKKCLSFLYSSNLPKKTHSILVDNSRNQAKQAEIITRFPEVKLIQSPYNIGFAAGNNLGIKQALLSGATHILLLNPDTTVPKTFLKPLLDVFNKDKETGIVAPALKHQQKNQWFYGLEGHIDWKLCKPDHVNVKEIKDHSFRKAEFVSFACVLIKSDVFKNVGFLDERYFMYLEDVDYCLQVAKYGYKIYLNPNVVVNHKTSASFKTPTDKLWPSFRSHVKFVRKRFFLHKQFILIIIAIIFYINLFFSFRLRSE